MGSPALRYVKEYNVTSSQKEKFMGRNCIVASGFCLRIKQGEDHLIAMELIQYLIYLSNHGYNLRQ